MSKHYFSNTELKIKIQYENLKVEQHFFPTSNSMEQSKLVNATMVRLFIDETIWETMWNYAFEIVHSTNPPNSLLGIHYMDSYVCAT